MKNGILVPKELWELHWHGQLEFLYTDNGTPNHVYHRTDGPAIKHPNGNILVFKWQSVQFIK